VIAAEDTRRLRSLVQALGETTSARIVSYYDAVERERIPVLMGELEAGKTVVLVTDAGTPSVSDPGYRLVAAAIHGGHRISAVPGPSAVLVALAVSGLPVDRFCFEGFLPRKAGERASRLTGLAQESRTMVFFEAPHRTSDTLDAMVSAFGPERQVALCRELTKTYEEVIRGEMAQVLAWAQNGVRGEVTLVVMGAPEPQEQAVDDATLAALVADRIGAGDSPKEAISQVAVETGVARRTVYDAVVAAKAASRGRVVQP
jgi:16S rRNA (cytidine1402-2'-O)-methyltransferase